MKYYSTRDFNTGASAAEAIKNGLAPDGGLYLPAEIPQMKIPEMAALCKMDYRGRAVRIMKLFLDEYTEEELADIADAAYGKFDAEGAAPVRVTNHGSAFLELWHGPTCAFKDMALQVLPYLLTGAVKKTGEDREVCILVATSGDTGKAALEGFKDVPGTKILVFYPRDGVSEIQKLQMVTQGGQNVLVSAVAGNFDDAQAGVKAIFSDGGLAEELKKREYILSSANSINWGRLLPQIVYYFSAYCDMEAYGEVKPGAEIVFSVPTGNFGDILAGWYAKRMGLPIKRLVCASNSNNVLTEFINTGVYNRRRQFYTTISPSMDILVSSNLERLLSALSGSDAEVREHMRLLTSEGAYAVRPELLSALKAEFAGGFCDDAATKRRIAETFGEEGYLLDPHTAVGTKVLADYRAKTGETAPAVTLSTASPFKFAADVLDALGESAGGDPLRKLSDATGVPVPAPLKGIGERAVRFEGCVPKSGMRAAVEEFLN